MHRFILVLLFLLFVSHPSRGGEDGFRPLLQKDLAGWKTVPESARDAFQVKEDGGDLVLHIRGKPLAYLHTEKPFGDFTLRYEWKATKEAKGGLLVHIAGPHKVWPRCIQVQMLDRDHGRLFTMGGATGRFSRDPAAQMKAVKEGAWNLTEVISKEGKLTVHINGVEVSSGSSELKEGFIGFQSEGAEVQIKNVRIK